MGFTNTVTGVFPVRDYVDMSLWKVNRQNINMDRRFWTSRTIAIESEVLSFLKSRVKKGYPYVGF